MKGKLIFLLGCLIGTTTAVHAQFTFTNNPTGLTLTGYTGTNGDVTIPDSANGQPVTQIGDQAFDSCYWLTNLTISDGVTAIGANAFNYCHNLTGLTIPASVRSIGAGAFEACSGIGTILLSDNVTNLEPWALAECTGLTNVTLPGNLVSLNDALLYGCSSLGSLTIPAGVTNLGVSVFAGCTSLSSLLIPGGVGRIGSSAFQDCASLGQITLPEGLRSIDSGTFAGCVNLASCAIPATVTNISGGAFYGCATLTNITLPGNLMTLGADVFAGCNQLASLAIPGSVASLATNGFEYALGLKSVTLGEGITSIADGGFIGCLGLTNLVLPGSLTNIGAAAFAGCSGLIHLTLPGGVRQMGTNAFADCSQLSDIWINEGATEIGDAAFFRCTNLTTIHLSTSLTSIGINAFEYCTNLSSVAVPGGITNFGWGAFSLCYSLTNATLAEGLTQLGDDLFGDCSRLTGITLPNSLTNLGNGAFRGCSALSTITVPAHVTSVGWEPFLGCSGLQSINVAPQNTSFRSIDGVLFDGPQTVLLAFPPARGGAYVISAGTTQIADGAFSYGQLTSVSVPAGFTNLGSAAFAGDYRLTNVLFLGDAPATAWTSSFTGDTNTTVYYLYGTAGWSYAFAGRPTSLLNPPNQDPSLPTIITQPQSQTLAVGASLTLSVGLDRLGPFAYQWQRHGSNLPNYRNITRLAGNGFTGSNGDGGLATQAGLNNPGGVAVDPAGNIYVADTANHRIRKVDTHGFITTVAGNGNALFQGDGGPAIQASLNHPAGLLVDGVGNLLIADANNNRIRKVDSQGIITTIAGTNFAGFAGDGGPAVNARLSVPTAIASDGAGNLFIADSGNGRVRKVDPQGIITTVAGKGGTGYSPDGTVATNATFGILQSVACDAQGSVFIADYQYNRVRKIRPDGTLATAVGDGFARYAGDGGPAANASLDSPASIAFDGRGNLYIADAMNFRIRQVDTNGVITTLAGSVGSGSPGDGGPAANSHLGILSSLACDLAGNLYLTEQSSHELRQIAAAGSPTLTVSNIWALHAGDYQVVITTPSGSLTSAVATVTVTGFSPPIQATQIKYEPHANQKFSCYFSGPLGQTLIIDRSPNLVDWTPIYTNTLGNSPFFVSDTGTNASRRFYRPRIP